MKVSSITKRNGLSLAAERKNASAKVTWFGSSKAPPSFGMRSVPVSLMR